MGLVQREIEAAGFTTITLSPVPDLTAAVSVPRIAAIECPLGGTLGQPSDATGQAVVLRATLAALAAIQAPGGIVHLPFVWPEDPKQVRNGPPEPPPIARYLARIHHRGGKTVKGTAMNADLELAKALLHGQGKALVLVKGGEVLATGERQGVADLLALVDRLGQAARGASLADRVVGKAAALIAASVGVTAIYTPLVSELAQAALVVQAIHLQYERSVPGILNRQGNGPCPMERLVQEVEDPEQAVQTLRDFIALSSPQPTARRV